MDRTDSRPAHSPETASHDVASPFNFQPAGAADRLDFEPVPLRHRRDGLTPEKQREFVEALADTGVVREAAARIGISEQAVSRVRRRSDAADFDRACEAAHMFGARRLRSIAFERAIEGTLKGHYYHGELVSQERVFDNRLLVYLLGKIGHLLEPAREAAAVFENWEPCMDALEQGRPAPAPIPVERDVEDRTGEDEDEDPQVWREDGIWWTYFPPPEGFDGEEEGDAGDSDYQRTLTEEEAAVMRARDRAADEAELARCCALRDRYFDLPKRGCSEAFHPQASRNNETSETLDEEEEEDRGEGPIEYKSLFPPVPSSREGAHQSIASMGSRRPGPMNTEAGDSRWRRSWIPDQVPGDGEEATERRTRRPELS
jgi:hypothetical protein